MRGKWLIRSVSALLLLVAGTLAHAPYLPRLLAEGYPSATWPAPGSFVSIAGASPRTPDETPDERTAPKSLALDPQLAAAFDATKGRALLASRNGVLLVEHYAPGIGRQTRLNSYSMVKSLIGALVLRAIAEGRIADASAPLGTLLPGLPGGSDATTGYPMAAMPLCRLLDMRSGIRFQPDARGDASDAGPKDFETSKFNVLGPLARLHAGGLDAVTPRLLTSVPASQQACGEGRYSYQNVNTAILGAVLERAYGLPLEVLLSDKIWKPAGAQDAVWRRYDAGLPVTPYCCLYARPIDWLRVGEFLMANGTPAQPFLPDALWRAFLGLDLKPGQRGHYSNQVYHDLLDRAGEPLAGRFAYFMGSRGQTTYLKPDDGLVAIRFGGQMPLLHSTLYGIGRTLAATP